jgi:type IV pilus assembly protein PilQ
MKPIETSISLLVLSAGIVLAQAPISPAPVAPAPATTPAAIEPPTAPPVTPGTPAANPGNTPAPIEPPVQNPNAAAGTPGATVTLDPTTIGGDPNAPRVSEFTGDPIGIVLRTLARQAKMSVVVSPQVQGTVDMRLEGKTPKEVIEIIVQANGLVMDQLNEVYYIKTAAEKAKEPTEQYQHTLSYAQAKDVVVLLKSQLASGLAPEFDQRTNTVFYREGKSNADKVKLFLVSIDRPTQQVMIEARLVEVTASPKQAYGINWGGVVGSSSTPQTFKYGGSGSVAEGDPPNAIVIDKDSQKLKPAEFFLNGKARGAFGQMLGGQFAILSAPQMSATLRFLMEDGDAEFIANPRITTANNETANIEITRAQPVPMLNFNEQTGTAVFSGFQDKKFGNSLTVTPSINKDDFVSLTVKPKISNKVGDATFTFSGATVASPIIDERTFDSKVVIKTGDTLAIGGLLQDEVSKARSKVPIMGDVPLFGYFFQERINTRTKRNLLVFVTPTIIKQGYGTGLEYQAGGLENSGNEYADPNGWRNNAKGAIQLVKTRTTPLAAEYPIPSAPTRSKTTVRRTTVQSK